MANDRLGQFEREIRAKSEARDAELAEVREALGVALAKQAATEGRLNDLSAVVSSLRDLRPPGLLAFWGPGLALTAALASAGTFVLNTTLDPVKSMAKGTAEDTRELSALYGGISREQAKGSVIQERNTTWLRTLEGRLGDVTKRVERLDERSKP